MCGISGFYNIAKQQVSENLLDKFIKIQHHRGPDAHGKFYDNHIGFAHNRLSLLDLTESGNQPFVTDDYILVYNGEIYNFLELQKELPKLEINSSSDTAVLFQALKCWGIDETLKRIKGMFAFAWYNRLSKKLILVRDRIGIKPLFYGIKDNTYYFSSELKTILGADQFNIHSVRVLYSTLGILEKSNSFTAWDSIFHVPPGSYVVIDENGHREVHYFEITDYVEAQEYNRLLKAKTTDVIAEFDSLMEEAVKSYLIADASVGAFVSGGIDSSLIASYCSQMTNNFKMFTANMVGKYSEIPYARLLSEETGAELHESIYQPEMAITDIVDATWYYESPLVIHFNAIPFRRVAGLTREHSVKAVLTGEGSDELFLGYPKLLTRRYNSLLQFPYRFLDKIYGRNPALKRYMQGSSNGLESIFKVGVQGFERQMNREQTIGRYDFLPEKQREEHYLSARMMKEGIVSLLWRNDRMGMANSIESRFPFLDERILQFSMNLPVNYKINTSYKFHNYKHPFLIDKYIVRKVGERHLSKALTNRRKKGFPITGLSDYKMSKQLFENGFVTAILGINSQQLDYMFNKYSRHHLGKFLALEIWGRLFVLNEDRQQVNELVARNLFFEVK